MGRHQFGNQNYKVVVGNEGQRRTYIEHDDREGGGSRRGNHSHSHNRVWRRDDQHQGGSSNNKRVSFHGDRRGGAIRKRGIRGRLGAAPPLDIIVERDQGSSGHGDRSLQSGRARPLMGSIRGKYSVRGRGNGRGGYIVPSNLVIRKALGTSSGSSSLAWHKVTLENASKYPKEDVIQAMFKSFPTTNRLKFAPIGFTKIGMNYMFHVESDAVADAIDKMNKSVYVYGPSDGQPLIIRIDKAPPPKILLTDEMWEKTKVVMSSRYTPATKALDLKSFHTDPVFLTESLFVPLSRSVILKKIIQIIEENIPEVEAIDLSDNRINSLDQMSGFFNKASNLKILYLANNRLEDPAELKFLKGLKLIDFKLEGNGVIHKLKDNYTNIIRKLFPTLVMLDGAELPKIITFEDDASGPVTNGRLGFPPTQMKSICNEEAGKIVLQFLEEYFKVYDSDNRQALLDAYHENAVMSMSAAYPPQGNAYNGMKEYTVQSRNLCRVVDSTRRQKLLHQGRLSIFTFLKDLPKTLHDPTSFTLDVPFATERLMTFTVTGVFKERESTEVDPIRHFNRMFVVVPQGSGFCIVNETLFVTTATPIQIKSYFKAPQSNVTDGLVTSLTQKTGMNGTWSRKCLEETGWDLAKAEIAFRNAHQEGKIPIEAFEQ